MLKKLPLFSLIVLFSLPLMSQTIVSTSPENKKVILEEFTGVKCVWCPAGHVIAQGIQNANPGNVFLINIHVGSFANPDACFPDYRTSFGSAINNQAGVVGYPAGTVNREVFAGMSQNGANGTAMSRNFWASASNQILAQPAYVNVGVESSINIQNREITVHVEAFYTSGSPVSTNKLNVALLQNNTKGPQVGGNAGDQYDHQHRLIHMLTGQWGVDINTTTAGTFVDQTFTYTIPMNHNNIPIELADLEVVAFIAETTQKIANGNGAYPTFTGFTHGNDVNLRSIVEMGPQCNGFMTPVVNVQNNGSNPITSINFEYHVNGGTPENYTWNGNLAPFEYALIELPEISYTSQASNTLVVSVGNDDNNSNNQRTYNFDAAVESAHQATLTVQTDAWGSELRWNIRNSSGAIVFQGGPYGNNQTISVPLTFVDDCYRFSIIDTYGDGGGPANLTDSNGVVIYSTSGNYCSGESVNFKTSGNLSTADNSLAQVVLYPNPTSNILNIQTKNNIDIQIFDITGKSVFSANQVSNGSQLQLGSLKAGLYLVKLIDGQNQSTQKLIIK